MPRSLSLAIAIAVLLPLAVGTVVESARAEEPSSDKAVEFFEKQVRPLLVDKCYECHSQQAGKQKGNLLLDSRAGWIKGGDSGASIAPGKPDESLLIKAVRYDADFVQMPPTGKLPEAAVATLVKWIEMGAPDPRVTGEAAARPKAQINIEQARRHWAFQPVQDSSPPPVQNTDWLQTPVDHFILAGLEASGLAPAPPADKRTWIRRVTFDLTGLPPTPEEAAAFVADDSPQAHARVVDRLLESPHYGERWGRHWL
ncbi:MAG: DUF1549 domain-containing protein, partial [Pirellulaceae bacterium]